MYIFAQKRVSLGIIYCLLLLFLFTACKNYGTKLEFNNGELYYTNNVEESDARKLGEFLSKDSFYFDGRPKSVQLDKSGSNYIFRAVVKEGVAADTSNIMPFSALGILLSEQVFQHAPVEVEMCDEGFKTLKNIPFRN